MATHRDEVRAARSAVNRRAQELGINMDAERRKPGSNQRMLTHDALKLINDITPRTTREQQQVDDPPAGAFNGVNTTYTLSAPCVGANIDVIWGDMNAPRQLVLVKSSANPPAAGEFFFDLNAPTVIVLGTPPQNGDSLVAVFRVER